MGYVSVYPPVIVGTSSIWLERRDGRVLSGDRSSEPEDLWRRRRPWGRARTGDADFARRGSTASDVVSSEGLEHPVVKLTVPTASANSTRNPGTSQ